jgi:hypothetical protein
MARELGCDQTLIRDSLQEISDHLMAHYASVCAGMSEEEAPYWAVFLTAISEDELNGLGELVVSLLISALVDHDGGLAQPMLESSQVYSYLTARAKKDLAALKDLSSSPSETLALVMLASGRFSLRDELDMALERLDHAHLNIFIPDSYLEFSQPFILKGINHVFQVGQKVWKVEDLLERWNVSCRPQLLKDMSLNNPLTRIGAICSALLMPNRVPWFLFDETVGREMPGEAPTLSK